MSHYVVTGAASGIGLAVLEALVADGARVTAVDVAPVPDGAAVVGVRADARSEDEMGEAIRRGEERFGAIDGVVAGAGIARPGTIDSLTLEDWREVIDTNLTSVFVLAQLTVPRMRAAGGGSFVAVASQHGLVGDPANAAYCAAKAGVINLVRCLALDHASEGIRANAVCPGPIDTPMMRASLAAPGGSADLVTGRVPMRRLGTAAEVAAAVLFLLDEKSSFVTGAPLVVDGGYVAQ